ncbi:hypothetical protein PIB30_014428 [Stylosanthes scabra]|uniref:Uncharacterized protein n=1 Tax=Stylosanthes scabra TaxID=79078 RepID=A0ABU6V5R2_9FABA|nr:hypothetical protein [Stylosanthes scabra]
MATSFLHLMVTANNKNHHEDQQQQPIIMDNNPLLSTVSSEETTTTRISAEHIGGRIIRSGRNTNKGSSSRVNKPKKPPQRGLGVEQLERLRMQECWKKMMLMNDSSSSSSSGVVLPTTTSEYYHYHHPHHYPNNMVAFCGNNNGGVTMKFGGAPPAATRSHHVHGGGFHFIPQQQQVLHGNAVGHFMGTTRGALLSGVSSSSSSPSSSSSSSFGSVAMAPLLNPLIVGTPLVETSRSELSSIPNLNPHFQPLDFCLKKTRFNNEDNNVNVNGSNARKESPLIIWNNNGPNFVGYEAVPNLDGEVITEITKNNNEAAAADEGVEVVAVHRKGNSVCGRVFMEYEFFPGKDARGTSSKDLEFPTIAAAPEPSPITAPPPPPPPPTTTPYRKVPPHSNSNNNIDLSLKLSR